MEDDTKICSNKNHESAYLFHKNQRRGKKPEFFVCDPSLVGAYYMQPPTHVPFFPYDLLFKNTCSVTGGGQLTWWHKRKRSTKPTNVR